MQSLTKDGFDKILVDADTAYKEKKYTDALLLYRKIDSDDAPVLVKIKMAACELFLGDPCAGLSILLPLSEKDDVNKLVFVWLGKIYLSLSKFDIAYFYIKKSSQHYEQDLGIARDFITAAIMLCLELPSRASLEKLVDAIDWSIRLPEVSAENFSILARLFVGRILLLPKSVLMRLVVMFRRMDIEKRSPGVYAVFGMFLLAQLDASGAEIVNFLDRVNLGVSVPKYIELVIDFMRMTILYEIESGKSRFISLQEKGCESILFNDTPFCGLNTYFPKVQSVFTPKVDDGSVFDFVLLKAANINRYDTVVFSVADISYFIKFASRFLAGIKEYANNVAVHIHIVLDKLSDKSRIESLLAASVFNSVGISLSFSPFVNACYYATSRFLMAPRIIDLYNKSVVVVDIDGVINQDPGSSLAILDSLDIDIGFGFPKGYCRCLPWLYVAGGFVYFNKNLLNKIELESIFYNSFYSRVYPIELMNKNSQLWMVDQNCLFDVLTNCSESLKLGNITRFRFYSQPLGHKNA